MLGCSIMKKIFYIFTRQYMTKNEFDLLLQKTSATDIVQKYILDGIPFCFQENPGLYDIFRQTICNRFQIHPQNFTIVGSAKVGFSMAPEKYGNPFSEESDIDVVLVSEDLFQNLWLKLIEFKRTTVYKLSKYQRDRFNEFQSILFYGNIRLDMISADFPFVREWWEFFNTISLDDRFGPRRIRARIFKSWSHVSFYYENGIRKIKEQNESNSI